MGMMKLTGESALPLTAAESRARSPNLAEMSIKPLLAPLIL
jgi:hypothetical protein